MGFASIMKQWGKGKGSFTGGMLMIDNMPPYFLGFPIAPSEIRDSVDPDFDWVHSPGSRYQYPIYKNGGHRVIKFKVLFDAAYPVVRGESFGEGTTKKTLGGFARAINDSTGKGIFSQYMAAQHIEIAVALLEKFKLPKQGFAKILQNSMGSIVKVRAGESDPAPPLTLLALNPFKMYLGYVGKADIAQIRFNKFMFCTRIDVDIEFFVSPDYIFSALEDVKREVESLLGWIS